MSVAMTQASGLEHSPHARRADCSRAVVVVNPGRQYVYETVYAAYSGGLLGAFATGVYLGGRDPLSRIARRAAIAPGLGRVLSGVSNRIDDRLPDERIVSFPTLPLLARTMRRRAWGHEAERLALRACDARIAHWLTRLEPAPAIVHGFEFGALRSLDAARALGAITVLDVPMAHEYGERVHGAEGFDDRHSVRVRAERELADHLFVPSRFVESCLLEHGVPQRKITLIPYGASVPPAAPAHDDDAPLRALFVGTIGRRKGVDVLLEAWRGLAPANAELVLLGGAHGRDKRLVEDISGGCRWEGLLERNAVGDWYRRSDVFVFPSRAEGSAIVVYEAMAAGLAVVTTPQAGSVITDGFDGLIVPCDDADALAEKLELLHERPTLRALLGARARETIANRYTWDHYHRRVRAAYRAILDDRSPSDAVAHV